METQPVHKKEEQKEKPAKEDEEESEESEEEEEEQKTEKPKAKKVEEDEEEEEEEEKPAPIKPEFTKEQAVKQTEKFVKNLEKEVKDVVKKKIKDSISKLVPPKKKAEPKKPVIPKPKAPEPVPKKQEPKPIPAPQPKKVVPKPTPKPEVVVPKPKPEKKEVVPAVPSLSVDEAKQMVKEFEVLLIKDVESKVQDYVKDHLAKNPIKVYKPDPKTVSADDVSGDDERTLPADSLTEKEFKPEPEIDPIQHPHKPGHPLTASEEVFGGGREHAKKVA